MAIEKCQKCNKKTNKVLYFIREYHQWCCEQCYDDFNSKIDKVCNLCGGKLKGNREKFCSDNCQSKYANKK